MESLTTPEGRLNALKAINDEAQKLLGFLQDNEENIPKNLYDDLENKISLIESISSHGDDLRSDQERQHRG